MTLQGTAGGVSRDNLLSLNCISQSLCLGDGLQIWWAVLKQESAISFLARGSMQGHHVEW